MRVFTIGHGTRPIDEFVDCLAGPGVRTVVDIRRFPTSRRHPQFNGAQLAPALAANGIAYRHVEALGGRRSGEPDEDRFACITVGAFRSYAARMTTAEWQAALDDALAEPEPCLMCAETPWWRCHRRLVSELLAARGHEVLHLLERGRIEPHRRWHVAEYREGRLFLCGSEVA